MKSTHSRVADIDLEDTTTITTTTPPTASATSITATTTYLQVSQT